MVDERVVMLAEKDGFGGGDICNNVINADGGKIDRGNRGGNDGKDGGADGRRLLRFFIGLVVVDKPGEGTGMCGLRKKSGCSGDGEKAQYVTTGDGGGTNAEGTATTCWG